MGLVACNLAKKFNTPLHRTRAAIFLSMIETAPQICGIKIKNKKKFKEDKKRIINTNNMKKLYNFILNNLDYSATPDNILHCNYIYKYLKKYYF